MKSGKTRDCAVLLLVAWCSLWLPNQACARTYYVSPSGDDSGPGTSPSQPLRTLERLQSLHFEAQDRILFQGGTELEGSLDLSPSNTSPPLEIGSYGTGKAMISVPQGPGIAIRNLSNVTVSGLKIMGSGRTTNQDNGIEIVNDRKGGKMASDIVVDDVEITGFGMSGLLLHSAEEKSGYRHVRITRVEAYENGFAGIEIASKYPDSPHEDIYIGNSKAHHNPGIANYDGHSGSGIIMGGVRGGLIEHSEAYENGNMCDSFITGGPAGIWVWNADGVVVQFNKSYRNHTNNGADGGGYDLDGKTTNSVLQYNYSAENDGYGYQLAEFAGDNPFHNNVVRYNISVGDGNGTSVGALHVWGKVDQSSFENNITYSRADSRKMSYSISFERWVGMNLSFRNNIFYADAESALICRRDSSGQRLEMEGNTCAVQGQLRPIEWDDLRIETWDEWRRTTGFEKTGVLIQGISVPAEVLNLESKERFSESDFLSIAAIFEEKLGLCGDESAPNPLRPSCRSARASRQEK